jgi:hypothetical protein
MEEREKGRAVEGRSERGGAGVRDRMREIE